MPDRPKRHFQSTWAYVTVGFLIAWGLIVSYTLWDLTRPSSVATVMARATAERFISVENRLKQLETEVLFLQNKSSKSSKPARSGVLEVEYGSSDGKDEYANVQ